MPRLKVAIRASSTTPVSLCIPRVLPSAARTSLAPSPIRCASPGCFQQCLAEGPIPRLALGFAPLDQQVAHLSFVPSLLAGEQLEGALVPPSRIVGGQLPERVVAGERRVAQSGVDISVEGPRPVTGELSELTVLAIGPCLHRKGDLAVELPPLARSRARGTGTAA